MSIVQGAEGFVTETFGGPIGGLINTLSMGFLTRWLTNRKQESETQKKKQAKLDEEAELETKRIGAAADVLRQTEKYADLTKEEAEGKIRQQLADNKIEAVKEEKLTEEENILGFVEGKTQSLEDETKEDKKAKENGGTTDTKSEVDLLSIQAGTVNLQTGAIAEGEVAAPTLAAEVAGVAPVAKVAEGGVVTPAPIAGVAPVAPVAGEAKVAPVAISEPLTIQAPVVNVQQAGGEVVSTPGLQSLKPIARLAPIARARGR